jgi:hypothetical protein
MGRGRLRREGEEGREIGRGIWDPGLVGTYYLDPERGQLEPGHPIDWATLGAPGSKKFATRTSKTIDFNWGEKPPVPGGRGTYWSVRWVGRIFVPKDDEYEFFLDNVDDGGRLYLDGKKLLDVWRVQRSTPKSDKMFLKRGPHPIVLEYAQGPRHRLFGASDVEVVLLPTGTCRGLHSRRHALTSSTCAQVLETISGELVLIAWRLIIGALEGRNRIASAMRKLKRIR